MPAAERVFQDEKVIALANAASDGDLARMRRLIEAGADVKAVGTEGLTLTHFALYARRNAPEVMSLLLHAGADPISMLSTGDSVPRYAASRDNADPAVMAVLLDAGVSPDWRAPFGPYMDTSLLAFAIGGDNFGIVKLLVARGANINYVNPFTGSALHNALSSLRFQIAAFLVDAGIDLALRNETSPKILPKYRQSETAIEEFCSTEGGRRGGRAPAQIMAGWELLVAALAKRGVTMPCGL